MSHRQIPAPPANRAMPSPVSPTSYLRNPYRLQRIRERGGEQAVRKELDAIRTTERHQADRRSTRKS